MSIKALLPAILALLLAGFASSCKPDVIPDKPQDSKKEGGCRISPNTSGMIEARLELNTDIPEYFKVSYTITGADRRSERGFFGSYFSTDKKWELTAEEGEALQNCSVMLAVYAEQVNDFADELFGAGSKIDFSVSFTLTTPNDGYSLTWCGLEDEHFGDGDTLYERTVVALNRGLTDSLTGTGKTKYVQFDISLGEDGGYIISDPVWNKGNIIDRQ